MPPTEHRRFHRFPVEGISGTLETRGDVKVISISRTGLTLETSRHFAEGTFCSLLLEHQEHKAKVIVEVKWVRALSTGAEESTRVGASFFDIQLGGDPGIWEALRVDD